MNVRFGRLSCAVLSVCAWAAVTAWADTLEEVEKKIVDAADKVKSFTADVSTVTEAKGEGFSTSSRMQGTSEVMRKGDTVLMHMELKTTGVTKIGDQEQKMESTSLMVCDGDFNYVLTEQAGQKMAMKMKADPKMAGISSKQLFTEWGKENDLKLLPDEKVDGRDAYVIEVTPKKPGAATGKQLAYFDKEHGLMLKMVVMGEDGKPMSTTTLSNYKTGVDLKPDRFVFKAPEGVQVMDMTKAAPAVPAAPEKP